MGNKSEDEHKFSIDTKKMVLEMPLAAFTQEKIIPISTRYYLEVLPPNKPRCPDTTPPVRTTSVARGEKKKKNTAPSKPKPICFYLYAHVPRVRAPPLPCRVVGQTPLLEQPFLTKVMDLEQGFFL